MPEIRILVKDEQTRSLTSTIMALARDGFEVTGTASEAEALTRLRQGGCDLLVYTIRPPGATPDVSAASEPPLSLLMVRYAQDKYIGILGGGGWRLLPLDDRSETVRNALRSVAVSQGPEQKGATEALAEAALSALRSEPALLAAKLLETLQGLCNADQAALLVWDEAAGAFARERQPATGTSLARNGVEPLAAWALEEGKLVLAPAKETPPETQASLLAVGIAAALAAPLILGNKRLGALVLSRKTGGRPFAPAQRDAAAALAPSFAMALHAQQLRREMEDLLANGVQLQAKLKEKETETAELGGQIERRHQELRALNGLMQGQGKKVMELGEQYGSLASRYISALGAIVAVVESAAPGYEGFSELAAKQMKTLAEALDLPTEGLAEIAYLHDVGMFLPRPVLHRGATASPEEQKQMRDHPGVGRKLAERAGLALEAVLAVSHHHENWDGTGFPSGLKGKAIPAGARLLRVVDAYVGMVFGPERLPSSAALARMKEGEGKEYDPEVLQALARLAGAAKTERPASERPDVELVSTVSHELRSPLTFLEGYSELLASQEDLPEAARAQATEIHREVMHMSELVEDLLDASRYESGRFQLRLQEADLGELIRHAVAKATAATTRHRLGVMLPADPVIAQVDSSKIAQVLDNLLTNAIKYSPEGGVVRVSLRRQGDDGTAEVSIADQGIGIPADKQEMVFQKFYRVDSPLKHVVPGTGLGLSLCKHIVEAHGGKIWVDSKEGKGSTFFFVVPLKQRTPQESGVP